MFLVRGRTPVGCGRVVGELYYIRFDSKQRWYNGAVVVFILCWVSAYSNLERLAIDSIGFSVLKMALI